jgi:8-oxo-dGTP diphosphatase
MTATPSRKVTRVVVGVMLRDDGSVLLADRPAGKPYAGYWEFPGGKIETGEAAATALERELHEELGIGIGPSSPWVTFEFDYPHAYVELQFRLVCRWRGEPHAREGQQLCFVDPAGELPQPLLPAALPALRWLLLPPTILVARSADASGVAATARSAAALALDTPDGVLIDRSGDGIAAESAAEAECARRAAGFRGAWAKSEEDLRRASLGGFDFVLIRSAGLARRLESSPGPLPAYRQDSAAATSEACGRCAQRRWIDLRSRARRADDAPRRPDV